MEYNTGRSNLKIPEYGRNIQLMIEHLMSIEDREKRTAAASFIVNVMAQMNPQVKEAMDYKHKLWDHLHIISDFKLDVDSPFPPPAPESLDTKPEHIGYSHTNIKYGHYGRYITDIIQKACEYEPGEERDAFVHVIANQMKKSYLNWNRDSVTDVTIAENLSDLSGGKLTVPEESKLLATNEILSRNKKKKFTQKKDNSQNFQRRGHRPR